MKRKGDCIMEDGVPCGAVTLSVCMIVRDEEAVLERCLDCVRQFADEIVIVDTGSADGTVSIARRYTDKVYSFEWIYDFAAARNESYRHASMDYVMWLDADDVIEDGDIEKIKKLKENMPVGTEAVFMRYAGKPEKDRIWSAHSVLRDRITRRDREFKWIYPIHEIIPFPPGTVVLKRPDISIFHEKKKSNGRRNIELFERKIAGGYELTSFNRSYYVRELSTDGNHEEAVRQFGILEEEGGKGEILYALWFYIRSMEHLKRYDELLEKIPGLTERLGQSNMISCTAGDLCYRKKDYAGAREYYEKALETGADIGDYGIHFDAYVALLPYIGLARVHTAEGRREEALECLGKAEEAGPECMQLSLARLYYNHKFSDTPGFAPAGNGQGGNTDHDQ